MVLERKKVVFGGLSVILLIGVISSIVVFTRFISKKPGLNFVWQTYNKSVDYVAIDGTLISDNSKSDGILIIPDGYTEKNIEYKITTYNFSDKIERTHILFNSLPEFTHVSLLPNQVDASKIWVITFRQDTCYDSIVNYKPGTMAQGCDFVLYNYDLATDKLSDGFKLSFYVNEPVREIYLLAHDPVKNQVYIGVEYQLSKDEVMQWQKDYPDQVNISSQYFETDFIKFDANSNTSNGILQTGYWMSNGFNPAHKTLADTGKDGELYFIGECAIGCGGKNSLQGGLLTTQSYQTSSVPIFYYGQDIGPIRFLQVKADPKNNYVYVVTKSFDQNKPSGIFRYDVTTGRTFYVGLQPTNPNDDMRGLSVIDGNLAIGSFSGLAVYIPANDQWKILNQNNGLKNNNVDGVYGLKNGGVCVLHENDGASCLLQPLSGYLKTVQ